MRSYTAQAVNVPSDEKQKREWIKYQLKIRGLSIAKLARHHQASRQAVSSVLVRTNPRWEHVVASALDVNPAQLWPERYIANSSHPIPKMYSGKSL
jgi:Ner family transcriptional regulator